MAEAYNPKPEQAAILERAFELVNSVPYQVSARWLFYMLLQEGTYADKDCYKSRFLPLVAKARKAFYGGWRPDTLADDTRRAIERGRGFWQGRNWAKALGEQSECNMDMWHTQDYYVELWYEAKAMSGQFQHYTEHMMLRPFGGDPSIPYKWAIAKELEAAHRYYDLPIIILYFGDLDPKGLIIPESAAGDIQTWCSVPFKFIRAGLNPGDQDAYAIMENPDKPGTYQWEALDDDTARQVITSAVDPYVDHDAFEAELEKQETATDRLRRLWPDFMKLWDQDEQQP